MGKYYLYNKKAIFTIKSRASSHSLVSITDKLAKDREAAWHGG